MAATKLGIYNGALLLLQERPLNPDPAIGLAENREVRRTMDSIWDQGFVNRVLRTGQWQFATRTLQIDPSTSIQPSFGYRYAYPKPSDWLRTTGLSSEEYFTEPLTRFADEAMIWYSDANPLYVKYVSSDGKYGGDLSKWPEEFALYASAVMAMDAAPRTTGVVVSIESLEKTAMKRHSIAQGIDGSGRPTVFPSRGTWNNSRHGRYSARSGPWINPPSNS